MTEKIKLYKEIENFIYTKCQEKINLPFYVNYHPKDAKTNDLPVIFDKNYYIQCILALPKEREDEVNKKLEDGSKILVTDSRFELALYKDNESQNIIKCLLILIIYNVDEIETSDGMKFDKTLIDINNDYKLLEKLKKFMFEYIKINKREHVGKPAAPTIDTPVPGGSDGGKTINILEKVLLGETPYNLKFFNDVKSSIDFEDERMKKYIEKIKNVPSKLEIKLKHSSVDKNDNNNINSNKNNNNTCSGGNNNSSSKRRSGKDVNAMVNELTPNNKINDINELRENLLNEIPEELHELYNRFRNVNFTYKDYLNFLNGNEEGDEPKV